jgi:hypothetical protein
MSVHGTWQVNGEMTLTKSADINMTHLFFAILNRSRLKWFAGVCNWILSKNPKMCFSVSANCDSFSNKIISICKQARHDSGTISEVRGTYADFSKQREKFA